MRRRDRERGQALILVALGITGMLAVTGLAIDGGMEAANYRAAQNAADAAALAGVQLVWSDALVGTTPSTDTVTARAAKVVTDNGATADSVTSWYGTVPGGTAGSVQSNGTYSGGGSTGTPTTSCVPYCITAGRAQAEALKENVTTVGAAPLYPQTSTVVDLGNAVGTATSTGSVLTTSGLVESLAEASSASGAGGSATTTALVNCKQSSGGYGMAPVSNRSCTGGSSDSTLVSQNTVSDVTAGDLPVLVNEQAVQALSAPSIAGSTASASASAATQDAGATPGGTTTLTAVSQASGVAGTVTTGVSMTATAVTYTATMSVNPTSPPTISVVRSCSASNTALTVTVAGIVYGNMTLSSDCTLTVPAALSAALSALGVSIYGPPTPSCSGLSCTYTGCAVQMVATSALGAGDTLCVAGVTLSATVTGPVCSGASCTPAPCSGSGCSSASWYPGSNNATVALTGATVTVVAAVPTTTYLLRAVGITSTRPAATATAALRPITDVSPAQFGASPYAVPDVMQELDAPASFVSILSDTALGHVFYMWGSSLSSYGALPPSAPSGWTGRLSSSSAHSVGSTPTYASGVGSGPSPVATAGGRSWYLLPVVGGAGTIVAYCVLETDSSTAGYTNGARLVDSVPVLHGILPQALTDTSLLTAYPGQDTIAMTIRLGN